GLFLGTLLAFSLLPVHRRLSQRLARPTLAAVALALGSGIATIGGLSLLLYLVVTRGIVAASNVARGFEPEGPLRKMLLRLEEATRSSPFGPIDVTSRVRAIAARAASQLDESVAA